LRPGSYDAKVATLRAEAATRHAIYPQYDGLFDCWVLALVVRDWQGKGHSVFTIGEIVLVNPVPSIMTEGGPSQFSAYCPATGNVCSLDNADIRFIAVTRYAEVST